MAAGESERIDCEAPGRPATDVVARQWLSWRRRQGRHAHSLRPPRGISGGFREYLSRRVPRHCGRGDGAKDSDRRRLSHDRRWRGGNGVHRDGGEELEARREVGEVSASLEERKQGNRGFHGWTRI